MKRWPIVLLLLDSLIATVPFYYLYQLLLRAWENDVTRAFLIEAVIAFVMTFIIRFIVLNRGYTETQISGSTWTAEMRLQLSDFLRLLPLKFFQQRNIGQLTTLLTNDIQNYERVITHSTSEVVKLVTLASYLVVVSFFFDPYLALIQVGVILLGVPILIGCQRMAARMNHQQHVAIHRVVARMIEFVEGMPVFRAFALEQARFERLEDSFRQLKTASIRTEVMIAPFALAYSLLADFLIPIMFVASVWRFTTGNLSGTNWLAMLFITLALTQLLKGFVMHFAELRYLQVAKSRLDAVWQQQPLSYVEGTTLPTTFDVAFHDVSFRYDEDDVLRNVTFTAREGTTTAIIGPSGSGKSTILHALMRFADVSNGAITIGGTPLHQLNSDEWLTAISTVFQDVFLISGTIAENIRLGRPTATDEEVYEAAAKANCLSFIERLPLQMDTIVTEQGNNLSGGEKQRLSLARAFLKNAPILLLDEATAALDADNERDILVALERLKRDKTVFVIAHRLHTIVAAEQILLLDDGQLIATGTHRELLRHERYKRLVEAHEQTLHWQYA